MKFWYDCEFLEDGHTIDLISIGMVAEDGRNLYLINADADWARIADHPWLMTNVVPHLPVVPALVNKENPCGINFRNSGVKSYRDIGRHVSSFTMPYRYTNGPNGEKIDEPVQLWTWFGAYDHVVLMQLFGPMIDKPTHLPMMSYDLKQVCDENQITSLPELRHDLEEHSAIDDARQLERRWNWVNERYDMGYLR